MKNKQNGIWAHMLSILALPFLITVIVPYIIHHNVIDQCCDILDLLPPSLIWIFGTIFFIPGIILFVTTIWLFATIGKGTLAPWNPPKHLVIKGPYKHVRNPMISAVNMLLIAIALFLKDENILFFQFFFFCLNTVHFIIKEEPDLVKRFGKEYITYMENVGRWMPRIKPWEN